MDLRLQPAPLSLRLPPALLPIILPGSGEFRWDRSETDTLDDDEDDCLTTPSVLESTRSPITPSPESSTLSVLNCYSSRYHTPEPPTRLYGTKVPHMDYRSSSASPYYADRNNVLAPLPATQPHFSTLSDGTVLHQKSPSERIQDWHRASRHIPRTRSIDNQAIQCMQLNHATQKRGLSYASGGDDSDDDVSIARASPSTTRSPYTATHASIPIKTLRTPSIGCGGGLDGEVFGAGNSDERWHNDC
jgi:hypothetical protein